MSYRFSEEGHAHFWGDKRMYGVTSVLRVFGEPDQLINWAANCAVDAIENGATPEEARTAHTKKRDSAGDTGKTFHKLLEDAMNDWIEEGTPIYTENDIANKVINWLYDNGYKPVKSELPVYSESLFYAGITDILLEKNGEYFVGDFKTGNSIQPTAFIQCGAYSYAMKEMKLYKPIGVVVIHIPKGKQFSPARHTFIRYDILELEETWLHIFKAYLMYKNLKTITTPKRV